MKRHIVLSKKLQILNVVRLPPPLLPISTFRIAVGPFLRRRYVFDRGVKPDVKYLAFEAFLRHRDPPSEIARDAAVVNALVEPFARDRCHQERPTLARSEPRLQIADQGLLTQEKMLGRTHFQVCAAGDRRPRPDQVGRLQQSRAVFALVTAGAVELAVWTSADDVTVRKETPVVQRINLVQRALLDKAAVVQAFE